MANDPRGEGKGQVGGEGVCSVGRSYRRIVPVTTKSTSRRRTPNKRAAHANRERSVRAVSGSHLGGVGLNLRLAFLAPDDQPHASRCGSPERHRRAAAAPLFAGRLWL